MFINRSKKVVTSAYFNACRNQCSILHGYSVHPYPQSSGYPHIF